MSDSGPAVSTSTKFQAGDAWRGNARGRPRLGESIAEYVRQVGGPDGRQYIDKLHELAVGAHRDTKSRLRALEVLLDRGWGKAETNLNLSGSLTTLDPARLARLSDAELEQAAILVAKLLAEEG